MDRCYALDCFAFRRPLLQRIASEGALADALGREQDHSVTQNGVQSRHAVRHPGCARFALVGLFLWESPEAESVLRMTGRMSIPHILMWCGAKFDGTKKNPRAV